MPDRDRPRPRRKKARASTSRWFERDERGVPLWAKVGAGAIAIMALIGLILKGIDRASKPKSSPNAAVTPAPTIPPPDQTPSSVPPKEPTPRTDDPPPKRVRVPIPIPPADEIIVRITVREVESEVPGQPPDLMFEYDYGTATPVSNKDVVCYRRGVALTYAGRQLTASKGSLRLSPTTFNSFFAGETEFWIERQEVGKFLRLSEIYVLRK